MKYLDFAIDYTIAVLVAWSMTTYITEDIAFVDLFTVLLITAALMGQKKA